MLRRLRLLLCPLVCASLASAACGQAESDKNAPLGSPTGSTSAPAEGGSPGVPPTSGGTANSSGGSGGSASLGGSEPVGGGGNPPNSGGAGMGGSGASGGAPPIPPFTKKNVVFIMADDMNTWVQPFGGHPQAQTPNIAKLAAKGLVFKNAHAPVSVCLPSRTAMLLGLRPHTSKMWGNDDGDFRAKPELKDRVTLPQFFRGQGYFTAQAGKIFHSPAGNDTPSWVAEFKGPMGTRVPNTYVSTHGMVFDGYNGEFPWGMHWGYTEEATEQTGDYLGAEYVAQLLRSEQKQPFFIAYGAAKPHQPWFVPKKYFDMFPPETLELPVVKEGDLDDIPREGIGLANGDHSEFVRTNNWRNGLQAYLASLAFADECIGRVLDALEQGPHKDNTIVVLMGDHGWHLGEKTHWGKATLWEAGTKTPLIIYDPKIARPGVTNEPVSLQDVYPTLVELNALQGAPTVLQGRSLVPLLVDPTNKGHVGWALSSWPNGSDTLRTERWSLIRHGSPGAYKYELYDMVADPHQHTNLASQPQHTELIALLSADIDNIVTTNAPLNQRVYEP